MMHSACPHTAHLRPSGLHHMRLKLLPFSGPSRKVEPGGCTFSQLWVGHLGSTGALVVCHRSNSSLQSSKRQARMSSHRPSQSEIPCWVHLTVRILWACPLLGFKAYKMSSTFVTTSCGPPPPPPHTHTHTPKAHYRFLVCLCSPRKDRARRPNLLNMVNPVLLRNMYGQLIQ